MFNFLICLRRAQTDIRKVHTDIRKVHTSIRLSQYKKGEFLIITLRKLRFFEIQKRLLLNPKHTG